MANGMDDRRKGLEEEYFHRKNQEAIEKLRAKMKVAAEAKAAGTSSMNVRVAMAVCRKANSKRSRSIPATSAAAFGSIPANWSN